MLLRNILQRNSASIEIIIIDLLKNPMLAEGDHQIIAAPTLVQKFS